MIKIYVKYSCFFIATVSLMNCSLFFDSYKSELEGNYIPKNLNDAIKVSDSILRFSKSQQIDTLNETEISIRYGRSFRNRWKLWAKSRLTRYFFSKGIYHPDDMSSIVLKSYIRKLKGEPIEVAKQIQFYKEYWKNMELISVYNQKFPEKNIEFDRTIYYKNSTGNFMNAKVYIQTDSGTNLFWIYDYYFGWKQINSETKTALISENVNNLEDLLRKIFQN